MVQKVEISSKTIIFAVFFLIFLNVLWTVRDVIYALFMGFIFMSALKPAVNHLEKQNLPRVVATLIVFIITLIGLFVLFGVVLPPLIQESIFFLRNLPFLIERTMPSASEYFNTDILSNLLPNITQNFIKVVTGVFSNLFFVVSVIFFTFYFLMEEKFFKSFLDKFLEEKKSDEISAIITKAERRMGAWVWGQVVLMMLIGFLTYIGLFVLQLKFLLPLAVLAGLLEIVPMVGPTIAAIPAVFVGLSISPVTGLSVIILYIVIQQLENNLIVPFVMKRAVGINPVMTLIALIIGGKLGGVLGIFLSVPTALFFETIFIEILKSRK